jgi:hypothetical protein
MHLLLKDFVIGKKVNDGIKCAFLVHMGNDPCSPHNNAVKCCDTLKNQSQHIENQSIVFVT